MGRPKGSRNRPEKFVYFFGDAYGNVKIGVTNQPLVRFERLANENETTIHPLCCFAGNEILERKLHWHFAAERSHHEWFRLSPRLETFIRELQACESILPVFSFEEIAESEARFQAILAS